MAYGYDGRGQLTVGDPEKMYIIRIREMPLSNMTAPVVVSELFGAGKLSLAGERYS